MPTAATPQEPVPHDPTALAASPDDVEAGLPTTNGRVDDVSSPAVVEIEAEQGQEGAGHISGVTFSCGRQHGLDLPFCALGFAAVVSAGCTAPSLCLQKSEVERNRAMLCSLILKCRQAITSIDAEHL